MTNILTMTVSDAYICIAITTRNHSNDKYFYYDRTRWLDMYCNNNPKPLPRQALTSEL